MRRKRGVRAPRARVTCGARGLPRERLVLPCLAGLRRRGGRGATVAWRAGLDKGAGRTFSAPRPCVACTAVLLPPSPSAGAMRPWRTELHCCRAGHTVSAIFTSHGFHGGPSGGMGGDRDRAAISARRGRDRASWEESERRWDRAPEGGSLITSLRYQTTLRQEDPKGAGGEVTHHMQRWPRGQRPAHVGELCTAGTSESPKSPGAQPGGNVPILKAPRGTADSQTPSS